MSIFNGKVIVEKNKLRSLWFVEYLCPDIKRYKCRKYGILEEREEGTPADVSRYTRIF